MEINGTIHKILPQQEVVFGDGTKKVKGGFVIMRDGDYPRPVAFELFGEDRLAMLANVSVGMPVQVRFFAESREGRNGNYFTSLRCTTLTPLIAASTIPANNTPNYGPWNPTAKQASDPSTSTGGTMLPQENDLPLDDDLDIF